jgi:hypothetical protein
MTTFVSDLIIVLREGSVAEQGTHEELMQMGGLYYRMWVEQAQAGDAGPVPIDSNSTQELREPSAGEV